MMWIVKGEWNKRICENIFHNECTGEYLRVKGDDIDELAIHGKTRLMKWLSIIHDDAIIQIKRNDVDEWTLRIEDFKITYNTPELVAIYSMIGRTVNGKYEHELKARFDDLVKRLKRMKVGEVLR